MKNIIRFALVMLGLCQLIGAAQATEVLLRQKADIVSSKFDSKSPDYKTQEYIEIKTARGATLPFIYETVEAPKGTIILLKGGDGKVDLSRKKGGGRGNFLTRTRGLFAQAGYNVVLPYLPKDKKKIYKFRTSSEHAADLSAIIEFLEAETGLKNWVAGTSYSGVSAANVAQAMGSEKVEGIILAAATLYDSFEDDAWQKAYEDRKSSGGSDYAIMKVGLVDTKSYDGKVVYLNNKADGCASSALKSDEDVTGLFPKAQVKIVHVDGGKDGKGSDLIKKFCRGNTKHGFFKIEKEAVKAATNAMGAF